MFSRLPGRCAQNRHTWPNKAQEEGRDEHERRHAPTHPQTHTHPYTDNFVIESHRKTKTAFISVASKGHLQTHPNNFLIQFKRTAEDLFVWRLS